MACYINKVIFPASSWSSTRSDSLGLVRYITLDDRPWFHLSKYTHARHYYVPACFHLCHRYLQVVTNFWLGLPGYVQKHLKTYISTRDLNFDIYLPHTHFKNYPLPTPHPPSLCLSYYRNFHIDPPTNIPPSHIFSLSVSHLFNYDKHTRWPTQTAQFVTIPNSHHFISLRYKYFEFIFLPKNRYSEGNIMWIQITQIYMLAL